MPEQKKHIDDFFREQLGGYTETPPAANWKNLEQKLDSTATPGSVVSYYKWLRYGIVIAVVAVVVFFSARRVLEPSGAPQHDAALAMNTQAGEGNVANGNAVAGDYTGNKQNGTQIDKQTNDNITTNENGGGASEAGPVNTTSQPQTGALDQQTSNLANAAQGQNKTIAANTPASTGANNTTVATNNTRQATNNAVANTARNGVTIANNTTGTNAGSQQGNKSNGGTAGHPAGQYASNNPQVSNATGNNGISNARAGARNSATIDNAANGGSTASAATVGSTAGGSVRNNRANKSNNDQPQGHLTVAKGNSTEGTTTNASAYNAQQNHRKSAAANSGVINAQGHGAKTYAAHSPVPAGNNNTITASAAKAGSRLKRGHIDAFAGKTSAVTYSQNSLKTVKAEPNKAAWQNKPGSNVAVSNSGAATAGTETAAGTGHASNSNPFRIPDDAGKANKAVNSSGVENIGSTGKVATSENAASVANGVEPGMSGGNSAPNTAVSGSTGATATATGSNSMGVASAAAATNLNANSNIASNRYNPQAAAMNNVITKPQDATSNVGDGKNVPSATNKPQQKAKKIYKPLVVESGIKIGYELGFKHFAANKYVISPYIEYGRGKWAVSLQPALKIARMSHTSNLGDAQVYYNVTRDPIYYLVPGSEHIYAQTHTADRTYAYNEAHDSISVTHHVATKSFSELEVPLLVNYKINDNLKVYGGALIDYTTIVQIQEDRHIAYYNRDTSITQVYSTLGPAPDVPEPSTVFSYAGSAYSLYSTKGYDNVSSSKLTFGYMLGFNYTIKDRYMLDVSMLQNISNMNYIPNEKIKGIYTQPYFRVSAGYKFLQAKKKRR